MSWDEMTAPGDPGDWLRFARGDLALAQTTPRPEVMLELLCFHAQQAAEKSLKAVLLQRQRQAPPRTHDLSFFMGLPAEDGIEPPDPGAVARLTVFAVMSRYPSGQKRMSQDEWMSAIETATQVVEWAGAQLDSYSAGSPDETGKRS
jgi:HEPN domain-containing protein